MKFVVTIDQDEDGMWIAECPSLQGCVSQGETMEEAVGNIKEAIGICLDVQADRTAGFEMRIEELSVEVRRLTQECNLLKDFLVNFAERYGIARPTWLVSYQHEPPGDRRQDLMYRRQRYERNLEWAEIWDRQGTLAEDVVSPCLGPLLGRMLGVKPGDICLVQGRQIRRHPLDGKTVACFDSIAEFGEYVIVPVTKRMIERDDVDEIPDAIEKLCEYFPEYRQRKIIGCAAGLRVAPEAVEYASQKGIIVLAVGSGEQCLEIKNDLGFQPEVFKFGNYV